MHKLHFPATDNTVSFPSDMHELTGDQFMQLIRYYLKYMQGAISYNALLSACAYIMLNMEMTYKKHWTALQKEHFNESLFQIGLACESFFDIRQAEDKVVFQLKHNFVNNLIPQFKHKNSIYYGPKDALENATWGEYLSAYLSFQLYVTTQQTKYLHKLIAALYRPSRSFHWWKSLSPTDSKIRRLPYSEALVERYAQELENIDPAIAHGIFLWFRGCQEFIATSTIEIEGNPVDLSILFKNDDDQGSQDKKPNLGLTGISMTLAEEGTFGDIDQVMQQNVYTVLLKLYQIVSTKPKSKPKPAHDAHS